MFCIDFSKHKAMFPDAQIDWAEVTLIGAVDAGIMAQNVLLAANRLGWAACILAHCAIMRKKCRTY
ncbi:nitroreductase family protein [Neisseria subflava]|uniref:nitroreductase family protein n=1 Tax=Neisseria subflava TaxID=28449 RepID=UPI00202A2853|nr:nitroreductase family protein [Neisseria subflava]